MTSAISIPGDGRNIKDINEALEVETRFKAQKANQQRYFYTLISNVKKVIGAKHMGYYVDSNLLFNEALRVKKSINDWPEFIMKELNTNPTKWIERKKLKRIYEL